MPTGRPLVRCDWSHQSGSLMLTYHDTEWGVPVHNEHRHFEFLTLESAQAGLSWSTVLNKRENYRRAFAAFDPAKVAKFSSKRIAKLLEDPGIIRNRLKVQAAVTNAGCFLQLQDEFDGFDRYVWRFVDGHPKINHWRNMAEVPATSPESDALSKDLKRRGFRFVGSTIIYAHLQATGLVNDHLVTCFRHRPCARLK